MSMGMATITWKSQRRVGQEVGGRRRATVDGGYGRDQVGDDERKWKG